MDKNFSFFSAIKDFLDEFAEAYKYAELNFYQLKTEVVELLDKAKSKGYGNPDYCEMSIQVVDRFETDVTIQLIYKGKEGKFHRFKKKLDLGKLTNIPNVVRTRLANTGEATIKLSDYQNLYMVRESNIVDNVDFKHLYAFSLKNARGIPAHKELHIKDELFYYQVSLVYVYNDGDKEVRNKYFGTILNMPTEVQEKIAASEDKACYLNIKNS